MQAKGARGRKVFFPAAVLAAILFFVTASHGNAADLASAPGDSPASAGVAGRAMALEGILEVRVADYAHHSRTRYFLKMPSGRRIRLHFANHPPTNLLTGAQVVVQGARLADGSMMLASGSTSHINGKPQQPQQPAPSAVLPNTLGAQSTLVMLVNFQDDPGNQPYTVADAESTVFTTSSSFFLENSYQQTWLTGDVAGWFTIAVSSTTCDTASIASDAQAAAAAAGVDLSAYSHYVYAFPQNNNCGWAGSSSIGGTPSQSWINGTGGSGGLNVHIVDHELGHGLGLYHSHLLDCGTGAIVGSNCNVVEYGDILDTMGAPQTPSPEYNAFQKERLGWLNYGVSPSITTVQSSGTYIINAYELAGPGPNALKILKSIDPTTGAKSWYYVEARQAIGFDAFIANQPSETETDGVLVHIGTDGDGDSGDLLDMTPATPTYDWAFDPSLVTGQSFVDPTSGLTLATTWVTSTQAAVTIQFTSGLAVTTGQSSYGPGQTVSITSTATADGAPAANVGVKFTVTKANGSVVTSSATTNGKGTAVYKLKLGRRDPTGTYQVSAAATIDGTSVSAATSFAVQ